MKEAWGIFSSKILTAGDEEVEFAPFDVPTQAPAMPVAVDQLMTGAQERAEHLLSVVRAVARQQGSGDATSAGLVWTSEGGGLVATIHNEGTGSRVQLSANRIVPLAVSTVFGIFSGLLASVNSNGTSADAIVSIVIGFAVAIGLWGFVELRTKRRVEQLMSAVNRALLQMGEAPPVSLEAAEQVPQDHNSQEGGG